MEGHPFPCSGLVVGAVDAGDVHSFGDQVTDQEVIVGRLGREGHHDAGHTAGRAGTEQGVGIVVEGGAAGLEALNGGDEAGGCAVDRGADALYGGQYVSLASAK